MDRLLGTNDRSRDLIVAPNNIQGLGHSANLLKSIDDGLMRYLGSQQEESTAQKTRRIMGKLVESTTDEDLEVYITEFQYLIDSWFDDFERQTYDGQTLKELIQE